MFLHYFKTHKMYKIHKSLPVSGFHRPIIRSSLYFPFHQFVPLGLIHPRTGFLGVLPWGGRRRLLKHKIVNLPQSRAETENSSTRFKATLLLWQREREDCRLNEVLKSGTCHFNVLLGSASWEIDMMNGMTSRCWTACPGRCKLAPSDPKTKAPRCNGHPHSIQYY
jgi:hypothetical protein